MKAVIVGAGAIGGWMAGLLTEGGCDVSLFARGQTLEALRSQGLRVQRGSGERVYRLQASDDPAKLGSHDLVVVAVKAQNVPDIAPAVARLQQNDSPVVTALNGIPWWFFLMPGIALSGTVLKSVDPGGIASDLIEVRNLLGCVVHASTSCPAPGVIAVHGEDKLILGARYEQAETSESSLCAELRSALVRGGVTTVFSPNIRHDIWTKLWGNMTMNPLSVLTGATTGAMLRDPETRGLVRAMMLEMQALGAKIGLPLAMTPEARMEITLKLGDFKTSMLRDAEAGRALETGAILGALVEIADRLAEPTPFIRAVHGLLRVRSALF